MQHIRGQQRAYYWRRMEQDGDVMKNLSKLFGHKPGAESGEEAQAEQPAANDPAAEAAAGQTAPLQKPEFGLAFFVEDGAPKTFTRLPINIGRNEQNDLVLQDETVSAQHAQVYYDEVSDSKLIQMAASGLNSPTFGNLNAKAFG